MTDKVLFVATIDPFGVGGGPQATRAYMDATIDTFGAENVSIIIPDDVVIPMGYKECSFISIPRRHKLVGILEMFRGITGRFSKPTVNLIKKNPEKYSWCFFNCGRESGWSFRKLKNYKITKVTIHHNQEVEYCMDNKTIYTLGGRFPYIVKKEEKNAYIFSDFNLFLTLQDKNAFSQIYGYSRAINGMIGTFDYKHAPIVSPVAGAKKQFNIVASGSLSQYQTVHGIMDFFDNYYSIAKEYIPGLKILLTGRSPQQDIIDLQKKYSDVIDVVPSPNDIQKEVSKGVIYLCPTDIGGGLKLRAMDGLKNGLPVLVHEVSARGYDYFFSKPYFKVYNSKESFSDGLKDILNYLTENPNCEEQINHDYYEFFGYKKGLDRFKAAINWP